MDKAAQLAAWYRFNLDVWGPDLARWSYTDPAGRTYRPYPKDLWLVALSDREVVSLQRGLARFLQRVRAAVDAILSGPRGDGGMFFRLCTRSPKDAWRVLLAHKTQPEADEKAIAALSREQLELLRVRSFDDVLRLLAASERCKEDMAEFVEHSPPGGRGLSLVFMPWSPVRERELRCFARRGGRPFVCAYHGDAVRIESGDVPGLDHFLDGLFSRLAQGPERAVEALVVDFFLDSERQIRVVELNSFDEAIDTCGFGWDAVCAATNGP